MAGMVRTKRAAEPKSKQPRFTPGNVPFGSWMDWGRILEIEVPPYVTDNRKRDQWLRKVWRLEPHVAGVVNAVTLIDSNRGWELVGGRNQVNRFTNVLHSADAGFGWRMFARKASLSYWCTDIGAITEVGRDGKTGPMRAIWHVDSARCRLTGNMEYPLEYIPTTGASQKWRDLDYMRVCSLPSDDEALRSLGYCALSRAIEVLRVLYAVMLHDQEQLAARAPKGLLLLQGITEDQWKQSLDARNEAMEGRNRDYYGGVQVLAGLGADQLNATLIALSQLPANFNQEIFTNHAMYALALCFGYDPSEFWPVQFGAMGRGTETEVQHMKATGKGGVDFALSFQEQLQLELPDTLHWEFEQRDDQGELITEDVKNKKITNTALLYNTGLAAGAPLLRREQALALLVEDGIIPQEWTVEEEDVTSTDTEDAEEEDTMDEEGLEEDSADPDGDSAKDAAEEILDAATGNTRRRSMSAQRLLETPEVQRAIEMNPREPIVRYRWNGIRAHVQPIWVPARRVWRGHGVKRSDSGDTVLYDKGDVVITQHDVDLAVAAAKRRMGAEFASLLTAPTLTDAQLESIGS